MPRKGEERKRGLPPIQLRAAEGASNWMQAGYVAQSGGMLGGGNLTGALGLGGKVGVAALLATLGVGAFGVGRLVAPRASDGAVGAQSLAFDHPMPARVGGAAATSSAEAAAQGAMQVVPESLGARPEAQANAAAAGSAPANPADPAAGASSAAGAAAMDAPPPGADLTAQAGKSPFAAKFGALSQFGAGHSGLNGGAGMSAINFDSKPLGAPKAFEAPTPATSNRRLQARAMQAGGATSHARGFAYRQLGKVNGLSRQGAAASGETSSTLASAAFNNSGVGGPVITGGGAGSAPVTGGGAGAAGSPIASATQNEQAGTSAAPAAKHSNTSPWKMIAIAGVAAMVLGMALLTFAHMKKQEAHKLWAMGPAMHPAALAAIGMAKVLGMIAAALGAIALGIGVAMWQQFHQKAFGGIFMAGGGLITLLGLKMLAARADEKAPSTKVDEVVETQTHSQPAQNPGVGANVNRNVGSALGNKP